MTLKKINENSYQIMNNEKKVGLVVFNDEYETRVYLENIDIYPEYQNNGFGTQAMKDFAKLYREKGIYFAPNNEDAKRLYDRIAEEMDVREYDIYGVYVDQGFGVYVMD